MSNLILSSSSITGTTVINSQGKELGTIKDLMIDTNNGTINYAVLSFGGFLGLGDKYFAIPFEAFTINETKEMFELNISKEKLENAPGFDKDNWPKNTDHNFWNGLYDYYGVKRRSFLNENQYA
ncbi:PRC-barrel domain-containing protein [Lewinella sp. W8]|uniref:PRC-barrel domain-containing protein n=1 Tax=Lewinella sp. W8 TaxID=2528208 RepID=UPI001068493D|nr:PRC-barrel domain-containing protein [Lewinella sp. W8]MTB51339.1 PRC-barrel domain containing protein [Lewinella sp. W8]